MHFQLIDFNDHALLRESVTITRRLPHPSLEAYEAQHVGAGRLMVTVDPVSGDAAVTSDRPLRDHLVLFAQPS